MVSKFVTPMKCIISAGYVIVISTPVFSSWEPTCLLSLLEFGQSQYMYYIMTLLKCFVKLIVTNELILWLPQTFLEILLWLITWEIRTCKQGENHSLFRAAAFCWEFSSVAVLFSVTFQKGFWCSEFGVFLSNVLKQVN